MLSEAFYEALELADRDRVTPINQLPGCWERDVDGHWWIAVNGHGSPVKCSRGMEVLPYTIAVWLDDWPAGLISPGGGVLVGPAAEREDALIEALRGAS